MNRLHNSPEDDFEIAAVTSGADMDFGAVASVCIRAWGRVPAQPQIE